jgi:hypothetical protein
MVGFSYFDRRHRLPPAVYTPECRSPNRVGFIASPVESIAEVWERAIGITCLSIARCWNGVPPDCAWGGIQSAPENLLGEGFCGLGNERGWYSSQDLLID